MESNREKKYDKAINYFQRGDLENCLKICESMLSEDLQNSELLNLKGLVLYQRGELDNAISIWKLNYEINNDFKSKTYIEDCEYDKERLGLFKKGEKELKKGNIDGAIRLFTQCSDSDFNNIKVNTGLALCYEKKGDYYNSKKYVDKALLLDKNAITANKIKDTLVKSNLQLYKGGKRKSYVVIFAVLVVLFSSGYFLFNRLKFSNKTENGEVTQNTDKVEKEDKIEMQSKDDESDELKNIFDSSKVTTLINNNDFNGLYNELKNNNYIKNSDRDIFNKAKSVLKKEGVQKFYEDGLAYYNEERYQAASNEFQKAYEYSQGNDLNEHIIFYLGSSLLNGEKANSALKFYEEYDKNYPQGSYIEGVLYQLSLLNSSNNIEKSKEYANKLISNYPNSMYINDLLLNIVNK